ncbi:hypothetical protein ACF0H5_024113 [Mactra antiquata]
MAKVEYLLALMLIGFLSVVHGEEKRAACVIQCDPGTGEYGDLELQQCPVDHECTRTGCGTLCIDKAQVLRSAVSRGACIMTCGKVMQKECGLNGYDCVSNGCGTECKLQDNYQQPEHCPAFNCDLHCMTGYYRDESGCDHCQCAYTIVDTSG